jgi:hypothetical protein
MKQLAQDQMLLGAMIRKVLKILLNMGWENCKSQNICQSNIFLVIIFLLSSKKFFCYSKNGLM